MVESNNIMNFTPDRGKSYKQRQGTFIPDDSVKKTASSFLVGNNQFRKHVFTDGSSIVAPKAYIPSASTIENNGAKKQGLNTMFRPDCEGTENGGFILNTSHNSY